MFIKPSLGSNAKMKEYTGAKGTPQCSNSPPAMLLPPVVSELDRWRAAQQLINQHGLGAELDAAGRADKAIDRGDAEGEALWRDMVRKIKSLTQTLDGNAH